MKFGSKTGRRLLILLSIVVLICGALGALLLVRQHIRQARFAEARRHAMDAYQAHDYARALEYFTDYLSHDRQSHLQDAEALFAYAEARLNVPSEGGRNIAEAIGAYQRYLQLSPTDGHDAAHRLLKLYEQTQDSRALGDMASRLLEKNPQDAEALRAQVQAFEQDHNHEQALGACRKLNQLVPLDLKWQWQELDLMEQLNRPADELIAHAQRLLKQHPKDPRFLALTAVAYAKGKKSEEARKALTEAAALPPANLDSSLRIIELLYADHLYGPSDELLSRAAAQYKDPRLLRMQVLRSFDRGDLKRLVETTAGLDPKSSQSDSELLGFRALALYDTGQRDQAAALTQALGDRPDAPSRAWATALRTRSATPPLSPGAAVQKYREAINSDGQNPVFHFLAAEAELTAGDSDRALQEWQTAFRQRPSWPLPLYRISRTYCEVGRYAEASRLAEQLIELKVPKWGLVADALATYGAISRSPDVATSEIGGKLLTLFSEIRANWPTEPDTVAPYVWLLCRRGQKDKAVEVVKSALALRPPLPDASLAELSRVCDEQHLDVGQKVIDTAQQAHGISPTVALARARALYDAGKKDEAVRLLDEMRQSHAGEVSWQLAQASFLDSIGDPGALNLWKDIAAAHPNDAAIQSEALLSPSHTADRQFWRQTIDRVRALSGEDGVLWQLEDARWRMAGPIGAQELESVVASLHKVVRAAPGNVDAHMTLADALLRENKPASIPDATTELIAAHRLLPRELRITTRLVQLLVARGSRDKALMLVDAVSHEQPLAPESRLWAARMYSELGSTNAAIKLLTDASTSQPLDPSHDALLASIYNQAGWVEEAGAAYRKVLDAPAADADALAAGAEFFAASGQSNVADQFLARLQKTPLRPGALDIVRARTAELLGSPGQELQILIVAARSTPKAEQVWQELAGFYLRQGELDRADQAALEGLKNLPSSATLQAMHTQIGRIRWIGLDHAGPLLEIISHDPRQASADLALQILTAAKERGDAPANMLASLGQLAAENLTLMPLQELLVRECLENGALNDAINAATRAATAVPNRIEPLQLLCRVNAVIGNWQAAREAADRWRDAALGDPLPADLAIASIYLRQPTPDPDAAARQLSPYIGKSASDTQRDSALPVYCQALIAAGRADDAAALLEPRLDQPRWRALWLQLSDAGHKDADAASAWVRRGAPRLKGDSIVEQIALADAWVKVGAKFDSAAACRNACDVLGPLVARPDPAPGAIAVWAQANQLLENLPESEKAWRRYLALRPDDASAMNNLAYVLLSKKDKAPLDEAEKLAAGAIKRAPGNSSFYDTLARVQLRAGKSVAAAQTFRDALARDPNNVEAMIGLADALRSSSSDRDEARSLLTRVDAALVGGTRLSASLRQELTRVRAAISSPG